MSYIYLMLLQTYLNLESCKKITYVEISLLLVIYPALSCLANWQGWRLESKAAGDKQDHDRRLYTEGLGEGLLLRIPNIILEGSMGGDH